MSPRESFNVLKKGAPSDLSIYFLKENMIYSSSWSVVAGGWWDKIWKPAGPELFREVYI